ncbi:MULTISPECIES: ornithine uptake porin CarO [unclassified Acinetobacter]|uniref:ornithine uptake porin CarO n=1 Tax=unclassified Acinetobacter TaxID=196816 RepID=UPI0023600ABC|nr:MULTISPECIES: ornithine uptake porin CarO [unclassified Acinetobacter]
MNVLRLVALSTALGTMAMTANAADEEIIKEDGSQFSFFKPASVRAEVGTTGYGGAITYNANPYVGVTLGYNGGDISWDDDVEYDDVNYDVDMDNNLTYLNAEIRPWANAFYMAAGVGYVDQEYGLRARSDGNPIKIDGQTTTYNSLSADVSYDNQIAPYLGLGYSPALNDRWGVFGEIGAYYTGNPSVTNVKTNGTSYAGGDPVLDNHLDEIRNDDKYEWLPVAKLGINYRF